MYKLLSQISSTKNFSLIKEHSASNLFFTGVHGSLKSFIISEAYKLNKKIIFLTNDSKKLFDIKDDLNTILKNEAANVYLDEYDEEMESEISALSSVLKLLSEDNNYLVLTTPSAISKSVLTEEEFRKNIIRLSKSQDFAFDNLISQLQRFGFVRKKSVETENDYAVRGGIIDVFPENLSQPMRIEFFGNEVESIREFDLVTQRSIGNLENTEILPSLEKIGDLSTSGNTLLDYIKEDALIILDEPDIIYDVHPEILQNLSGQKISCFSAFNLNKSVHLKATSGVTEINFHSHSQPSFHSNIKLLYDDLLNLVSGGYSVHLLSADDYQAKKFHELIEELDDGNRLKNIIYSESSIHEGFVLPGEKLAVYTEHELFGRYFRSSKRRKKFSGITFKDLAKVNNGDFMVHQTYGIGKYAGLKKINVGGVQQEAVKMFYEGNDALFVNLNSIHLIKKFAAQEGITPKLTKLGGTEWDRIKQKTKKKIQEIAQDLILLYSKRKAKKGFRFSSDTVWQKELEASFIYEDTPDQITSTEAVKADMESDIPMDRLICGDVGFGKTEVAIRAAFKSVLDNKQAAVLVPTTILAEQHYNTFRDRLSNYAVEVEHLSRFKTSKQQKEIIEKLQRGKINIIIGTHRLLSKDIKFKDLGLLVIDEEQRFGVQAKEKIKMVKENVDVLTLTATPIPRTLNFSLLGARDLSIINTPPKNRQPIHTEIINMDRKIIANAIMRELQRSGQVYFVNDKISQLEQLASMIEEIVPFAKVVIAHGQMKSAQLENVMMKFLEKKYNVLLCTKIIESGLDIPSVNTIIINRADNFGLAELYQLRGRVGRSNIKSFAYLIAPPQSTLTRQAVRRLHALEEFSELGSGMNLALKDLEIRGAGNLLGKEQSGFISEMGFDMYMQILDEAVTELKLEQGIVTETVQTKKTIEVQIETDVSAFIPEDYIDDENLRLEFYQRLSSSKENSEIESISNEMLDRFGKFPEEVISLFKQIEFKLLAGQTGFEKVSVHGNTAELYFNLKDEELFKSGRFEEMVNFLSKENRSNIHLVQSKKFLTLKCTLKNSGHSSEKLDEVGEIFESLNSLPEKSVPA